MALPSSLFPSALKSLAERFPLQRLDPEAISFLNTQLNRPWALACSGGADSVALLLLMRAHFPAQDLFILHFDHNLRPG